MGLDSRFIIPRPSFIIQLKSRVDRGRRVRPHVSDSLQAYRLQLRRAGAPLSYGADPGAASAWSPGMAAFRAHVRALHEELRKFARLERCLGVRLGTDASGANGSPDPACRIPGECSAAGTRAR